MSEKLSLRVGKFSIISIFGSMKVQASGDEMMKIVCECHCHNITLLVQVVHNLSGHGTAVSSIREQANRVKSLGEFLERCEKLSFREFFFCVTFLSHTSRRHWLSYHHRPKDEATGV